MVQCAGRNGVGREAATTRRAWEGAHSWARVPRQSGQRADAGKAGSSCEGKW
jgi:hypothetical protein